MESPDRSSGTKPNRGSKNKVIIHGLPDSLSSDRLKDDVNDVPPLQDENEVQPDSALKGVLRKTNKYSRRSSMESNVSSVTGNSFNNSDEMMVDGSGSTRGEDGFSLRDDILGRNGDYENLEEDNNPDPFYGVSKLTNEFFKEENNASSTINECDDVYDDETGSISSNISSWSDQIQKAARRGESNAGSVCSGTKSTGGRRRKRKKRHSSSKKSYGHQSSSSIRRTIEKSAKRALEKASVIDEEEETKVKIVSFNNQEKEEERDESWMFSSSMSSIATDCTEGSDLNPNKYKDPLYLKMASISKFEKGIKLVRKVKTKPRSPSPSHRNNNASEEVATSPNKKGKRAVVVTDERSIKYLKKAREKFRAALKARIILTDSTSHGSIAPVHEMLGHVEWKLGAYRQSTMHFSVALEICWDELRRFDETNLHKGGDNGDDTQNIVADEAIEIEGAADLVDEEHSGNTKRKKEAMGDDGQKEDLDKMEVENGSKSTPRKLARHTDEGAEDGAVKIEPTSDEAEKNTTIISSGVGKTKTPKEVNKNPNKESNSTKEVDQRELLVTNINRIKKAFESVGIEALQKQLEEENNFHVLTRNENVSEVNAPVTAREVNTNRSGRRVSNLDNIQEVDDETAASFTASPGNDLECTDSPSLSLEIEKKEKERQERLRNSYLTQMEKGEEQYNLKQYELAMASFNEAKFALLMRFGETNTVHYEGLRDQINSALLLERITDCQVQKLFKTPNFRDEMDEGGMSHVNYDGAATMLSAIKQRIKDQLDLRAKATKQESTENDEDIDEDDVSMDSFDMEKQQEDTGLNELLKMATVSLARIRSKQGLLYAKLENHHKALDLYRDSLNLWSESHGHKSRSELGFNIELFAENANLLIAKTNLIIHDESENENESKVPSHPDEKITPTYDFASDFIVLTSNDPQALVTSLQMAESHNALGVEALENSAEGAGGRTTAIRHHIAAFNLIVKAEHLKASHNIKSISRVGKRVIGLLKETKPHSRANIFSQASVSDLSNSSRTTTRSRDLTVLMTSADSKNMGTSNVVFMKRCKLLAAHQQIQISQALCCLGHNISLSEQWLREAIGALKEIEMPDEVSEASEVALYILYLLKKGSADQEKNVLMNGSNNANDGDANPLSLYEGGVAMLTNGTGGYDEKLRLTAHTGMAFLQKGLHIDAFFTLDEVIDGIRDLTNPPGYHQELQDAIDALVIINIKQDELDKALDLLKFRLELASRWEGDRSIKRAKELHRLGCFYSFRGDNAECIKQLDESISILLSDNDNPNAKMEMILDSAKLLATSHDALEQDADAVHQYEFAIDKETDFIKKAKLMNAISHLYCRSGKINHAFEYLDKSLALQKLEANNNDENTSILTDTMILYGNAMVSKKSYSEACFWYDSALNANTDKSPLHPNNLRAWYNKGVALFHSEDVIGAGHALGIIVDTIRKNPEARTRGVSFVLNGIGNIHFVNKRYENAIELYKESLSTDIEDFFTPCQRAGTLCNIATAEYKTGDLEGSNISVKNALKIANSMGDSSWEAKSIIFSKAAYVCYKRKEYSRAFDIYFEAASIRRKMIDQDEEFAVRCESYAETCRLQLAALSKEVVPTEINNTTAQKPTFGVDLIHISDGLNASRYRDTVYSSNAKMLMALGMDHTEHDSSVNILDKKSVCNMALQHFFKQTKDIRENFAQEFEELLVDKLISKYDVMKSFVGDELFNRHLQGKGMK